ncbi:ethanolamine ammonia-lyase subunit EutB [Escherichia coli]
MKLKTTLFSNVYQFKDVKEVLAKANELRSGDVLAGVAAASSQERVAAKQVLSEMTVADIRNNPVIAYEDDCVTRLIQDDVNETAYNQIKNWSISELREYVLSDETSVDDIAFTRKGLTSEVVAAVAKICSNADLIYGAKKMPVIKKANTTIGIPGTFSARLQPNDTRDDVQSIAAQIYEGLSFGVGDAVIGVNPVTDDVENLSRVLDTIYGVIDKFNIPTQGCVLAHVTTQIEAIRRGAPGGLIFQSICGSEKGLKEFGVELAMLDEAMSEPVTVLDLCNQLHVSRRTLQNAFHAILGIGPNAWLKRIRLNAVRRELISPWSQSTTVKDAAMQWGFWHLGQFATDYQQLFAEKPSLTLHQRMREWG